ncbi:glycosyltransferase family 39 protein [Spirosoma oryzicola]|uniref:glycosyltransferase family 39 protein n=1 Tax=Spirosoma oryzicola TaxID=2898794 RepID=UPI001E4EC1DF|nr:glycosyltransferase family 39 protein [Spirosoma oryzicola]UHG94031.1 glycosyltransferase family 39 protein [Spirosoma oryzicola]
MRAPAALLGYIPRFFTQKSITAFFTAFLLCSAFFFSRLLPPLWILFGFAEVYCFFFFLHKLTRRWSHVSNAVFEKKLFRTSLWIRIVWVVFSYVFYTTMLGEPFEFEAGDAKGYHGEALWLLGLIKDNKWSQYVSYIGKNYSDMGYPMYLGLVYYIVGENLLIPRLLKAVIGSFGALITYKLARNNFGEATGRMAGIMTMLVPNLIYYTGLHLKETEMVFVVVSFIYLGDRVIRSRQLKLADFALLSLLAIVLFFFRTVLAACLIASMFIAALFTSSRISGLAKRIGLVLILLTGIMLLATTPLADNVNEYLANSSNNVSSQMRNFSAHRAKGENNKLAVYGSTSVFLPLMLMAPFPTLVNIAEQQSAMMLAGAYFTRNVYAFFVFVALITLFKQRKLREHVLLLAFIASYILILASSGFALSERFHLPLLPFLLMFAAYGISQMNQRNKKYYQPYLVFIVLLIVGWNWFKIAGRS